MNNAKKIIAVFLCFIMCVFFCPAVFAADSTTPAITVSNKTAEPGGSVTIDIIISNNPGIMAMAFCITYDSDAFEYESYTKGYLTSYTVKDHPDSGHISFVNVESSDKSTDGTIISVTFNVKDNAAAGKHTVTLANINRDKYGYELKNSFSNSKSKYIVPSVTAGSITVSETCANSPHKYGDWVIEAQPTHTETGLKSHTCSRCGYIEKVSVPTAHDFEDEWTVDRVATEEQDGIMSRHCKICDEVTDTITFTLDEVESSKTPNNDAVNSNDSTENASSDNTSQTNTSDSSTGVEDLTDTGTAIDNTLGAKNPLSAVQNTKDYQENIEPDTENENESIDSEIVAADSDNSTQKAENSKKNWLIPTIITIVIIVIISAIWIILVLLNKRRQKEE